MCITVLHASMLQIVCTPRETDTVLNKKKNIPKCVGLVAWSDHVNPPTRARKKRPPGRRDDRPGPGGHRPSAGRVT